MISFRVRAREESRRRFPFYVVVDSSIRDMLRGQHRAILTPQGAQYDATRCKAEKRNRLRLPGLASPVQTAATLDYHPR